MAPPAIVSLLGLLVAGTIVCGVVFSAMLAPHDGTAVLREGRVFSPNASVVVAGAWRLPPPVGSGLVARGPLSRAFRLRLVRGLQVALRTGIRNIVLTGGRFDAIDARAWLVHTFGTGAVDGNLAADPVVAASLRLQESEAALDEPAGASPWAPLNEDEDTTDASTDVSNAPILAADGIRLWVENASTTTQTNALEAGKIIAANLTGGEVVVVTSPYHLRRATMYFAKHLPYRTVFSVPSAADEFEYVIPTRWWVQVQATITFVKPSPPSPAIAANASASDSKKNVSALPAPNASEASTANGSSPNTSTSTPKPPPVRDDVAVELSSSDLQAAAVAAGADGADGENAVDPGDLPPDVEFPSASSTSRGRDGRTRTASSSKATPKRTAQALDHDDSLPESIGYRVRVHPIAQLFPDCVVSTAHSLVVTWRHWTTHVRLTLWSAREFASMREIGAFAFNLFDGRFVLSDLGLVHGRDVVTSAPPPQNLAAEGSGDGKRAPRDEDSGAAGAAAPQPAVRMEPTV